MGNQSASAGVATRSDCWRCDMVESKSACIVGDDESVCIVKEAQQLPTLLGFSSIEQDWQANREEESIEDLLRSLEAGVQAISKKYKQLKRSDVATMKRVNGAIRRVQQRLTSITQMRKSHTHSLDRLEADVFLSMYGGARPRRFKNLQSIVRKVQAERQIIEHWKRQTHFLAVSRPLDIGNDIALNVDSWTEVSAFELEKDCQQPLARAFMAIWKHRHLDSLCRVEQPSVLKFIQAIESGYHNNPYHNRIHAADVTLSSYYFWSQIVARKNWSDYFVQIDLLVLLIAAAVHDVGHVAVNNDFLVKTRNELAIKYNDKSVLENHSAATCFKLMKDMGVRLLEHHNLPTPPPGALRERVIDMVLATDMAFHKQVFEQLVSELDIHPNMHDINKLVVEKNILHLADIGHPLRPLEQHKEWTFRVTEEFLAQGDREKGLGLQPMALFDRDQAPPVAKAQLGFLNFVVSPAWAPLRQVLGELAREPDECFKSNRSHWEALAAKAG